MAQNFSPAITRLQDLSIPHRIFQHTGEVRTLEQAARERNQIPEQVIRSLLFRVSDNHFVMVLMPGPGQVPWKSLRRFLNQSRVTMATEDELLSVTGCLPGSVNPISVQQPIRTLVERSILTFAEISLGSCIRSTAIIMAPADLLRAIAPYEIVDLKD